MLRMSKHYRASAGDKATAQLDLLLVNFHKSCIVTPSTELYGHVVHQNFLLGCTGSCLV